jgi:hypothetical protein
MAAASVDKPRWLASPGTHQFSSAWADMDPPGPKSLLTVFGAEHGLWQAACDALTSGPDPFGLVESKQA